LEKSINVGETQFDFHSFSVQIFWTLLGFFVFYFTVVSEYINNLALLLKIRSKILINYYVNFSQSKKLTLNNFFFF